VIFLVLLKAEASGVAGVSSFVRKRPNAIVFVFGRLAANLIHVVDAGSKALRGGVVNRCFSSQGISQAVAL